MELINCGLLLKKDAFTNTVASDPSSRREAPFLQFLARSKKAVLGNGALTFACDPDLERLVFIRYLENPLLLLEKLGLENQDLFMQAMLIYC